MRNGYLIVYYREYGDEHNFEWIAMDLIDIIHRFGEFNTFRRADAGSILKKAHLALAENGRLLLEAHTFVAVRALGEQPSTWYSSESGLFSDRPHICLTESFWDTQQNVATERYFILDGLTGKARR